MKTNDGSADKVDGIKDTAKPKTAFEVNAEIRKKTTKCPSNFKCLTANNCPGCEIESLISENYAFVKMKEKNRNCPYAIPFGLSFLCSCPTRCEIYRKHNK
jgi:hypothetical protein